LKNVKTCQVLFGEITMRSITKCQYTCFRMCCNQMNLLDLQEQTTAVHFLGLQKRPASHLLMRVYQALHVEPDLLSFYWCNDSCYMGPCGPEWAHLRPRSCCASLVKASMLCSRYARCHHAAFFWQAMRICGVDCRSGVT